LSEAAHCPRFLDPGGFFFVYQSTSYSQRQQFPSKYAYELISNATTMGKSNFFCPYCPESNVVLTRDIITTCGNVTFFSSRGIQHAYFSDFVTLLAEFFCSA
jgi:hypothetical protein